MPGETDPAVISAPELRMARIIKNQPAGFQQQKVTTFPIAVRTKPVLHIICDPPLFCLRPAASLRPAAALLLPPLRRAPRRRALLPAARAIAVDGCLLLLIQVWTIGKEWI